MKTFSTLNLICLVSALCATMAQAAPDQYPGDTAIYGSQVVLEPNVLLVIDTSSSMRDASVTGGNYNNTATYSSMDICGDTWLDTCSANAVYRYIPQTDGNPAIYEFVNSNVNNIPSSCTYTYKDSRGRNQTQTNTPRSDLTGNTGKYTSSTLTVDGTGCGTRTPSTTYMLGKYVNYLFAPGSPTPKIDVVKNVVDKLIKSTTGVRFGVMTYYYPNYQSPQYYGKGGTFVSGIPYGSTQTYTTTIMPMDDMFDSNVSMDNRTALRRVVRTISLPGDVTDAANTPLAETLYEAGQYFKGAAPAYGSTTGLAGTTYSSPADPSCRKNYVVFLTDGMSTADVKSTYTTKAQLSGTLGSITIPSVTCTSGDCDADGKEPVSSGNDYSHSFDDVAEYLYLNAQQVVTYAIGFDVASDQTARDLLARAVDKDHGHGGYYEATSQADLAKAFDTIVANILAVNSSFVAPVVPVSPDNRTYGGNRLYMGFFKPVDGTATWLGNLKKYGLNATNDAVDLNGAVATNADGSFKITAKSFWSTNIDGGDVDKGGVGALLQTLTSINTTRTIYTTTSKTDGASLIQLNSKTGSAYNITPAMLGYTATDTTSGTNLINFIYGLDSYGSTPTQNRSWVMGDVLHSKPLIVNYNKYTFSSANEINSTMNKTMLYVGANDGMLHAFNDYNGSEAWAFIPYGMQPNLQYINGEVHPYFVDSTPSVYLYNKLNDGIINTTTDKVILMFGERRGGGENVASTTVPMGSYHVLDVTTSTTPTFKYTIDNTTTGFSELGESWSEPKIVKMRVTVGGVTQDRIIAFFGAGYDNVNEDMRYGNTQSFSGVSPVNNADIGHDTAVPAVKEVSAAGTALSQHGRGIYAVQLATLTSGVPAITATPTKIWGVTYGATTTTGVNPATNSAMTFSFPGEIAAMDVDGTGYTTRLYTADTGGNIWRVDVADNNPANWKAIKIFSSNPGSGDTGRKIFYKPSVVAEPDYTMILFGTGDREHPRNTAVTDRIYALKDKGQQTADNITETNLMDVTLDTLQASDTSASSVKTIADTLILNSNYGWYIKLDQNNGEKVLAAPLVFNKVGYFTTYAPGVTSTDECGTGNLGTARMYAVQYKTGEAVINYDLANDSAGSANKRATREDANGNPYVLARSDRVMTSGSGIPSGVVMVINPNGTLSILTGIGGALRNDKPLPGGTIIPLYWRPQ